MKLYGEMLVIAAATMLAVATAVHAHDFSGATARPGAAAGSLPLADYRAFDSFAIAHPEIVSDLGRDSRLIQNEEYLQQHPQLRDFLSTHAELRSALINDPGDFIELRSKQPAP